MGCAGNSGVLHIQTRASALRPSTGHYRFPVANTATFSWPRDRTDLGVFVIGEDDPITSPPTGQGTLLLSRGVSTAMFEAYRVPSMTNFWNLGAYALIVATHLNFDRASLVTGSTVIIGSRPGIHATAPAAGAFLERDVSQPLTTERGAARMTYAVGYDLTSSPLPDGTTDASPVTQRRLQPVTGFVRNGLGPRFRLGFVRDVRRGSTAVLTGTSLLF